MSNESAESRKHDSERGVSSLTSAGTHYAGLRRHERKEDEVTLDGATFSPAGDGVIIQPTIDEDSHFRQKLPKPGSSADDKPP